MKTRYLCIGIQKRLRFFFINLLLVFWVPAETARTIFILVKIQTFASRFSYIKCISKINRYNRNLTTHFFVYKEKPIPLYRISRKDFNFFFINLLLVASCCDSTRLFSFSDAKLTNLSLPANICLHFNSVKIQIFTNTLII